MDDSIMKDLDLILVDVRALGVTGQNDEGASGDLTRQLNRLLTNLPCCQAQEYYDDEYCKYSSQATTTTTTTTKENNSHGNHNTISTKNALEKEIVKFLKETDRYAALVSLLFKRRAFYRAVAANQRHITANNNNNNNLQSSLSTLFPLVLLPRTRHKKPYIPPPIPTTSTTRLNSDNNNNKERNQDNSDNVELSLCNWFPLSISHQFPYVGLAHFVFSNNNNTVNNHNNQNRHAQDYKLGLDIVVFDEINPKLYTSVEQFVRVFWDQCAPSEQAVLQKCIGNDFVLLRELYLHWCIKEAYTKALGVGLGFDFASFATTILGNDDPNGSLWNCVSQGWNNDMCNSGSSCCCCRRRRRRPLLRCGRIQFGKRNGRPDEYWMFAFQLLFDDDNGRNMARKDNQLDNRNESSSSLSTASMAQGCACVCWGPLPQPHKHTSSTQDDNHSLKKNMNPHDPAMLTTTRIHVKWKKTWEQLVALPEHGNNDDDDKDDE